MPYLVPGEVQLVAELHRLQKRLGRIVEVFAGDGELAVVLIEETVVLGVEVIDPTLLVAVETHLLHAPPPGQPVDIRAPAGRASCRSIRRTEISGRLFQLIRRPTSWVTGSPDMAGTVLGGRPRRGGAHMAGGAGAPGDSPRPRPISRSPC